MTLKKHILFIAIISLIYTTTNYSLCTFKGFLCTIEGIDGAGKSTLLAKLQELFKKTEIPTFFTREPGATNLGKKLRTIILEKEVQTCPLSEFLLFAADRAQHFQDFIVPKLEAEYLIISDRMADSSMAYQGYLKGLNLEMIATVNKWCMQQIQPDLTIYLKISADEAKKRITTLRNISDKFEQNIINDLEKLIQAFDTIFSKRDTIIIVDAHQDSEIIAEQIFKRIVELYQIKQYAKKQYTS